MALVSASEGKGFRALVAAKPVSRDVLARFQAGADRANATARGKGQWNQKIRPDMFAPYTLVLYADHISPKDAKKKGFNKFVFMLPNFDESDYKAMGLNPDFTRWNKEENCLELAVQRFIKKGDDLKEDKNFYPPEKKDWQWVKIHPLTLFSHTDFNATNVGSYELTISRLWEVVPRARDPEKKDDYGTWGLRVASIVPEQTVPKIRYETACALVRQLPEAMYQIADRIHKSPGSDEKQDLALVRFYMPHEEEALCEVLGREIYSFAQFTCRFSIDDWTAVPKDKKLIETMPQWPKENEQDKKERVLMRFGMYITLYQRDAKGTETQRVAGLSLWDNQVRNVFGFTDISRWGEVGRYWVPHLTGITTLVSINPSTDKDSYNMQLSAGDPNAPDAVEGEEEEEADDKKPAAAAAQGAEGEEDLDALMNQQTANSGKQQKAARFSGWLSLSALRVYFDQAMAYHCEAVPVTAEWSMQPVVSASGVKAMNAFMRTIKTPQGTFPLPLDQLNVGKPEKLPPVVDISGRSPGSEAVRAFGPLVKAGHGEFRVMTNSPLLVVKDDDSAEVKAQRRVLFTSLRDMSPEDGVKLLKDGFVISNGVKVELPLAREPQHQLWYVNRYAINPEARSKQAEAALNTLSKYITSGKFRNESHDQDVDMHDGQDVQTPAAITPGVAVTPANPMAPQTPAAAATADIPHAEVVSESVPTQKRSKEEGSEEYASKKHRHKSSSSEKKEKKGK